MKGALLLALSEGFERAANTSRSAVQTPKRPNLKVQSQK